MKTSSVLLWAWWDAEKKTFCHIYPKEICVRICSPDGFAKAEADGRGKVMRVKVSAVKENI